MIEKHSHSRIEYMIKVRSSKLILAHFNLLFHLLSKLDQQDFCSSIWFFCGTRLFRARRLSARLAAPVQSQSGAGVEGNRLSLLSELTVEMLENGNSLSPALLIGLGFLFFRQKVSLSADQLPTTWRFTFQFQTTRTRQSLKPPLEASSGFQRTAKSSGPLNLFQ